MNKIKKTLAIILIMAVAVPIPFGTEGGFARRRPPSKVYGLRLVKSTKSSITIRWRKARRARKYIVYRSKGSKGRFVKRIVTRRTRFTDYRVRPGTTYRYFVRGYNGRVGRRSNILKVRTKPGPYVRKSWKMGGNGVNLYNRKKGGRSNVKAILYSNGLLKIVGKGNTAVFTDKVNAPWKELDPNTFWTGYDSYIKRIEISKTVRPTNIDYLFSVCDNLRSINRIPASVKSMESAFAMSGLVSCPDIPNGVKNMAGAFSNSGLKYAPKLSGTVEDLSGAFAETYIKKAPAIPKKAKFLNYTFSGCRELEKAAAIPAENSIKNAEEMYESCKKLTGEMYVKGVLGDEVDVTGFFKGAATESSADLKVLCSNTGGMALKMTVEKLVATKSPNSNIISAFY